MSEDIVERVARAMAPHAFVDDEPDSTAPNYWRSKARKALEAMREPTEAMLEAAAETPGMKAAGDAMVMHQARGYDFKAGSFDDGSPLHQAFRAMIDAALKG